MTAINCSVPGPAHTLPATHPTDALEALWLASCEKYGRW